jgi:conjugative relaxase-like TrwC/TraI family protein
MLSIAALTGGPGYYLELANISYYLEGGEPLPIYHGTAAKELGLSGVAEREHIERLCAGFHHTRDDLHVRNAGKEKRNPGQDLCFSAPKSVSSAWARADDELRKAVEQKHLSAVKQALDYLESKAGFSRIGAQGQELVKAPLLFVLFEHGTSRAMDPQLHTHSLCINLTVHPNGRRVTAVDTTHLYHLKMAAGAVYRAALAHGMREIGWEVEQRKIGASIGFELKCIPEELIREESKRRAEIEEKLKIRKGSLDAADPKYAELLAKETRRTKDTEKPRSELLREWQETGREFGVDAASLRSALKPHQKLQTAERDRRKEEIAREAVEALSERYAHWSEADFTKAIAERAAGRISAKDALELVANKLSSPEMVYLGKLQTEKRGTENQYLDRFQARYSTPEIRAMERGMIVSIERIVRGPRSESRTDYVEEAIAKRPMFATKDGKEQAEAVRYLTSGPAIRVLSGIAGSGKTKALDACVEVWNREGREVIGCSFQKAVASKLEREIGDGISCDTVHKTLYRLDRGDLKLHEKSVVLMDESAMLGTKLLARLIRHVEKAPGCRLLLVGDAKQLQPVTEGGAHKYIADLLSEKRLKNVKRQEEIWAREAVVDIERGAAREAIQAYIDHGRFHVTENRPEAMDRMIEQWKRDGGIEKPQDVALICATNHEVKELSLRAQAERIRAGVVDANRKVYGDEVFFHVNDQVRFKKNSRTLGVDNADLGTVIDVTDEPGKERMKVKLEKDGREITVDFKRYQANNIVLGYSWTTYSIQGGTLPHAHVLMGGSMTSDLHMGYVQLSRSIKSSHLFVDKYTAGGPELADLLRDLGHERQKTLAQEIVDRNNGRRRERVQEQGLSLGF